MLPVFTAARAAYLPSLLPLLLPGLRGGEKLYVERAKRQGGKDGKLEREKEEMEAVVDMSRERMKGWEGSSVERRCGDSRWRKRSEEISLERPGRI